MQTSIETLSAKSTAPVLGASYQPSLEPISRAEVDSIRCFFYINPQVAEADLEQFDNWFLQLRRKPEVFSTSRKGQVTFHASIQGDEVPVDWRVYRTWANTFHLRYEEVLKQLGLKTSNPFIHPEKQYLVTGLMQKGGLKPKALADCILPKELS